MPARLPAASRRSRRSIPATTAALVLAACVGKTRPALTPADAAIAPPAAVAPPETPLTAAQNHWV
ncbi:MAG: hypothetical protein HOQ11_12290, partial [Gemmatimonadaceae bacterium]|nr:hypothetical protein [Gemmatimonadaceae bacterium]